MMRLAVESYNIKHQLYSEVVMRLAVDSENIKHQLYSQVVIMLAVSDFHDFARIPFSTYVSKFQPILRIMKAERLLNCVLETNILITPYSVYSGVFSKRWEDKTCGQKELEMLKNMPVFKIL